ncbi:MAG: hypothetical protein IJO32_01955 [Bacilli bacterium]|nr:hypothetical protein [Bacilli bacterium]
MKKFILIFTLLFLFPLKVYGLTDLGYMELNENYIIDRNDFKFIYGNWMPYNEEDIENIEIKREYSYEIIKPLRYIEFSNTNLIDIKEIEIHHNNKKLSYSISCTNCDSFELEYLYDGIVNDDTKVYNLERRGKLVLRLDKYYSLNELSIRLNVVNINNTFDIIFSNDYYKYDNTIKKNIKLNDSESIIKIDDSWIFNVEYSEPIKTNNYIEETWYRKVENKSEYRTITKLFRHYKDDAKINQPIDVQEIIPLPTITNTSYKILENMEIPKINSNNNQVSILSNVKKNISEYIPNKIVDNNKKVEVKQTSNDYEDIEENNIVKNISINKLILLISILSMISILLIYINRNYRKC